MAGIINLRRARKAKARTDRKQEAAEKRRRFGRTKAEKDKDAAERDRLEKMLSGHKREND